MLVTVSASCGGTPVSYPPPLCGLLTVEPHPSIEGYFLVSGDEGCFPSPEEEGEGVRCWVTILGTGYQASMFVEPDGSCVVPIETESGDELTVTTQYPNGDESQPCYLVVP